MRPSRSRIGGQSLMMKVYRRAIDRANKYPGRWPMVPWCLHLLWGWRIDQPADRQFMPLNAPWGWRYCCLVHSKDRCTSKVFVEATDLVGAAGSEDLRLLPLVSSCVSA